jgi:Golgi nucleoside diphosphatase
MEEILSKCGYRCDLCPAYTENIKSEADKTAVSEGWKRLFGFNIPPDEIECMGCHNKGKQADAGCPVRPCVMEKGIENCALCESFECDSLKTRTGFVDDYLKKGGKAVSEEDYQRYVLAYEGRMRLINIRSKAGITD